MRVEVNKPLLQNLYNFFHYISANLPFLSHLMCIALSSTTQNSKKDGNTHTSHIYRALISSAFTKELSPWSGNNIFKKERGCAANNFPKISSSHKASESTCLSYQRLTFPTNSSPCFPGVVKFVPRTSFCDPTSSVPRFRTAVS